MARLAAGPGTESDPGTTVEAAARRVRSAVLLRHGLGPLILHHWSRTRSSLSFEAASWLDEIRDQVHADAAAMLPRHRGWEELLRALGKEGVPFCLLKGSGLRARGQGLPGRTQVDLDLLVPREELTRVEDFLHSRGYRLHTGFRGREGYLEDHFHLPLTGPWGMVELHWSLARAVPEEAISRFWKRTRWISVDGMNIRVLSQGDQLLHSCIHISEHAFQGMARWLGELTVEIAALGSQEEAAFQEEALRWPRRQVSAPLSLLHWWGAGREGDGPCRVLPEPLRVRSPLLPTALTAAAFNEGFPGAPPWVVGSSVSDWINSRRSYSTVLARSWVAAAGGKVRGGRKGPR